MLLCFNYFIKFVMDFPCVIVVVAAYLMHRRVSAIRAYYNLL